MKDPRLNNVSPNMTINNEVILINQFNSEENPFAEYMWMENEEEFNRQVSSRTDRTPDVWRQVEPTTAHELETRSHYVIRITGRVEAASDVPPHRHELRFTFTGKPSFH